MTQPLLRNLGYLGFRTQDLDRWHRLATDVLGMQVSEMSTDDVLRLKMDVRRYRVALHRADDEGLEYAGWEVQDMAALEEVAQALDGTGVAFKEADRAVAEERGVAALVRLDDPEGNRLEIYAGARTEEVTPFVSSTGARFVTGEMGMGHLVLVCARYDETFEFYTKVLGLPITDFLTGDEFQAAFLGASPRHHSIAIFDSKGRVSLVDHFMVEVDSLTTVGQAHDRCVEGAAPIAFTLGQHWNDYMTSFYVETPSGFDIEYGWGARRIDRSTWSSIQGTGEISFWGHQAASAEAAHKMRQTSWIADLRLKHAPEGAHGH